MGYQPATQTRTSEATWQKSAATSIKPLLSTGAPVHPILQLQQTIGNRAVNRLIQAKLKIGQPGDQYEREADWMADAVMRMPAPSTAAGMAAFGRPSGPHVQRASVESGEDLRRQPEEEEEEEKGILQSTTLPGIPPAEGGGGSASTASGVQFKGQDGGARGASNPLAIRTQLGSGCPLDGGVRARMESAFGMSFSHVRVHTDARSAALSNRFTARAFTVGGDIAFGSGEYRPGTVIGDALIAHELAHVIQQGEAKASSASANEAEPGCASLEADADFSAGCAVVSLWGRAKQGLTNIAENAVPRLKSGLQLQRCVSSPERDRHLAMESARCPSPPAQETMIVPSGRYADQRITLPYDRIVPEPDPTQGVDQAEVLRTYRDPRRLEQLYYDATTGNPRAAWLVCQAEAGARFIGRQGAQHLHSLGCMTVMRCEVRFEQLPFSDATTSGQRMRRIIANAFVAESRRLQLTHEIIGHGLMLLVGVAAARAALAGTAATTETAATRGVTGRTAVAGEGEAAGEARALAGETRAATRVSEVTAPEIIPGFTATETAIIREAQSILGSPEMASIRAAHAAGESATVRLGGRVIQYEPGLPASGMTMFGENGFMIGREAFVSEAELTRTVLHELYRLTTSSLAEGGAASAGMATAETQAASGFAERAYRQVLGVAR
jgi:hypothetical protein